MKCDRCGEAFDYYDNSLCGNSIQKKEFQEERICPFCGGKLHMKEFEIMNRW